MRVSRTAAAIAAAALVASCTTDAGGRLGVRWDNDLIARGEESDQDYTQGMRLEWTQPRGSERSLARAALAPLAVLDLARLDREPADDRVAAEETGWFLEQRIYTPRDFDLPGPIPDDRPFVGWLRLGVARTLAHLDVDPDRRHDRSSRLELSLGVTGPPSLAEQAQTAVHEILNEPRPVGWDNQVGFEPTVQLDWDHRRRAWFAPLTDSTAVDASWNLGWKLGNFWTNANARVEARAGWHLPRALAPWADEPGGDALAERLGWRQPRWSLFVWVGLGGRAVARDLSIQGGTFDDETDLHAEPLVGVLDAGVAFQRGGFWLGYGFTAQTRTYEEQESTHQYGSLRFGYVWTP